ncbi:unnamed protein product [Rhizophagus irregularis]|nr:unnamed protein product [Rhizophagus irregularis]
MPSVIFFISIPNNISESFYNGQVFHQILPPILCLYTDGGPDHRSVHMAPNHSWTNPAEWVMSTLNIGLQGVALKRDQMSPGSEALFKTANMLDNI